ncbi:hypothetical protein PENTCL1PPCAC_16143, partial [Pristionchus entomophagus]
MVYNVTQSNATIPAIVDGFGGRAYYIPYKYGSVIGPEHWWEENKQLHTYAYVQQHWTYTIWIAVAYSVGIHALQSAMANRRPFELKTPLILWNAALAVFSLAGAIRMFEEFSYVLRTRPLLESILYTVDINSSAAFWGFAFVVSKIFELVDTVFIVLRKKPLIFLHWYHHAIVVVYATQSYTELVAGCRWFVTMNYAIHALMYAYYALAAAGYRLPRVMSMVITTLQTTQMLIGVAISFIVLYCKLQGRIAQQSFENLALCFGLYASFAILFMSFFNKSYLSEEEKKKK